LGKLIVIESGTDSSGKATQAKLLYQKLVEKGYRVMKVEFPDYKSKSSSLIKMYLNGEFGEKPDDVNPYASSTFYAVDRYASFKKIWKDFYDEGGIILADRYTTSNMIHQASKFNNEKDKEEYLNWLTDLEFEKIGLPKPDGVIFLDVDPEISFKLMENRKNKFTGEDKKDIHETAKDYLTKTYHNACCLSKLYNWEIINCIENNKIRSIENISTDVYDKAKRILSNDIISVSDMEI